jgi:glycerol-3-phosphate O-acyltransferase
MREYVAANGADLRQLGDADRRIAVTRLGDTLMRRISQVIPVLPVSLVACVLVRAFGTPLSELELKSRALALISILEQRGARIYIPRQDQDYAIGVGLRMLTLRRLVVETEGLFAVLPAELPVLAYYANAIAHLLEAGTPEPVATGAGAVAATAVLASSMQ